MLEIEAYVIVTVMAVILSKRVSLMVALIFFPLLSSSAAGSDSGRGSS